MPGGKIGSVCMLSTHGYFDPIPQLGRTDTGGQVLYVLQLAKAFTKLGMKVDIYTRWFDESKGQIDPMVDCPDVRIIRIKAGPWDFIPKEKIYDVLPELANNMIDFIRKNNLDYDLFHGHYVDAGIVTLDVARAFNKPTFFTSHSLGAWKRENVSGDVGEMEIKYNFDKRISEELRIFKSVTGQTVTSTFEREKIKELYGFTSPRITDIPPGVDIHIFHPLPPGQGKVDTGLPERYVFCLGRIGATKGRDLLLKAFDIVGREVPDIHLVIGGGSPKPGPEERAVLDNMNKIIDEKGMQEKVHLLGYVPDEMMVPYYRQAELFVLPSVFEPFGMTVVEAMACGTPVVASKTAGVADVLVHGENALLAEPTNIKELAEAMITILKDPQLAENITQEGLKTVQEHLSWEAIACKHLEFYSQFI